MDETPTGTHEDVADEVDDFHLQRYKALLDHIVHDGKGEIGETRRGTDEREESEESEVYGLDDGDKDEDDLEDYASSEEGEGGGNQRMTEVRRSAMLSDDDQRDGDKDEEDGIVG